MPEISSGFSDVNASWFFLDASQASQAKQAKVVEKSHFKDTLSSLRKQRDAIRFREMSPKFQGEVSP